jgi:hypothetical protein|tara:strand:+ start:133 stop:288 length:156 start_codon:yes stop_codon:yes gene_type:complete
MKWWSLIKETGGQTFGSHGANPLHNISYGKNVEKKPLSDDEEEEELVIAKD